MSTFYWINIYKIYLVKVSSINSLWYKKTIFGLLKYKILK